MRKFKEVSLVYLIRNHRYLMLLRNKKENDINQGKWIGVGGKKEEGETIEDCAIREVKEETGYRIDTLEKRGIIDFIYTDKDYERMHLYTSNDFHGQEKQCNEGTLAWVKEEDVFALNLWQGDLLFLNYLIEGKMNIDIELTYDEGDCLIKIWDKGENKIWENQSLSELLEGLLQEKHQSVGI